MNRIYDSTQPLHYINAKFGTSFTDNSSLQPDIVVSYLKSLMQSRLGRDNGLLWDKKVASQEKILEDFNNMNYDTINTLLETNLKIRSIVGHATHGHTVFNTPHPNTSIETIINNTILEKIPILPKEKNSPRQQFLIESQEHINKIADKFVEAIYTNKEHINLLDYENKPLIGLPYFNDLSINPLALLKGASFGGFFDNLGIREEGSTKYSMESAGGGKSILLNTSKARKANINLDEFTTKNYNDPILNKLDDNNLYLTLVKSGIIREIPEPDLSVPTWNEVLKQGYNYAENNTFIPHYYRIKKGHGVSDDIAIALANFIEFDPKNQKRDQSWYLGLQIGAYLADFADTFEKAAMYFLPDGQDETLARFINKKWLKRVREDKWYRNNHSIKLASIEEQVEHGEEYALVSKDEIVDLTAIAKNPKRTHFKGKKRNTIHSSQSYFTRLIKHKESYTTTFEQEFSLMNKILREEYSISASHFSAKQVNLNIGFEKQEFFKVADYIKNDLIPLIENPKKRERRIKIFYS